MIFIQDELLKLIERVGVSEQRYIVRGCNTVRVDAKHSNIDLLCNLTRGRVTLKLLGLEELSTRLC